MEKREKKGAGFGHWQDPEYQIRPLPALAPSRDPGFSRLIRTSPINRTRNYDDTALQPLIFWLKIGSIVMMHICTEI